MALPQGVSACTVTFGPYTDQAGRPLQGSVTIVPSSDVTFNGAPLLRGPIPTKLVNGAGSVVLPHTDQEGMTAGSNSVINWTYLAVIRFKTEVPGEQDIRPFSFSLPQELGDTWDLDTAVPIEGVPGELIPTLVTAAQLEAALTPVQTSASDALAAANAVANALPTKVDKITGKVLSDNNYSTPDKSKLAGIADGATVNAPDSQLRDRGTHTGTQAIATVSGLQADLDAKAAAITARAPVASPSFTGTVTVPTPSATGAAANKGYVDTATAAKVDENVIIFNAKKTGTGIKGDRQAVYTAAMTSGSAVVTTTLPGGVTFTSADIGKAVTVAGAGTAGATLRSTIASINSTTSVTLADNASTTVSGKYFVWGTDDTAALAAAIEAVMVSGISPRRAGHLLIPKMSRCMITDTVFVRRATGGISGAGWSDWTTGTNVASFGSMLFWDGPSGKPMFQLEQTTHFRFENLALIGNPIPDSRPSALIRYYVPGSGQLNAQPSVENCIFGRLGSYGGFAGTTAERVADVAIAFEGSNLNNDRFRIVGGRIEGCTTGVYLPNSQSVIGYIKGLTFYNNDTHIATSAQVKLEDVYFGYSAVRDLDISSSARVDIYEFGSEFSSQLARMRGQSSLIVHGGYYQLTNFLIDNSSRVVIDAVDDRRQVIRLSNLRVDVSSGWGTWAPPVLVRAHAATNSALSNKLIELDNVRQEGATNYGVTPSWLDVTPIGALESVIVFGNVQPAGGGNQNHGVQQFFWNVLRSASDTVDFTRDDRMGNLTTAAPDIQEFSGAGTYTWTKPAGAKRYEIVCIEPGNGGGSGRRGASGTVCGGGGGGAAGVMVRASGPITDWGSTETVTIPAVGAGGAAVTADSTNGNAGSAPGSGGTRFGTSNPKRIVARSATGSSGAGQGGTTTGGTAGQSPYAAGTNSQMSGGAAGGTGAAGAAVNYAILGPAGGPGGGGISATPAAFNGGAGNYSLLGSTAAGAAGVVDTTPPTAGTVPTLKGTPGQSPGGGAASITTAAQAGATATGYGAGGAGGGASLNGSNSGAGGDGGPGYVLVISYF